MRRVWAREQGISKLQGKGKHKMVDEPYVEKLIKKYEKKLGDAEAKYQETGWDRYDDAAYEALTIVQALQRSLDEQDNEDKYRSYQAMIMVWADRAASGRYDGNDELVRDVIAFAKAYGLARKDRKDEI